MRDKEVVENYLLEMGLTYEQLNDSTWLIDDEDLGANLVIRWEEPIIVFRVKLMEIPQDKREALFQKMLELNATELVHGAYGIEEDNIVLVDALQVENLDFNEFQASVDSMTMAMSQHYPILKGFRN